MKEKRRLISKETIRELMKDGTLKDAKDIQTLLKEQFKEVIEEMLEGELDNELGYSKYDYRNKETDNTRNGKRKKKIKTEYGDMDIEVPRDRTGEFEPLVVKKRQKDVSGIEDRVISMYAKGMSVRDIQEHLYDIYGIDVSASRRWK